MLTIVALQIVLPIVLLGWQMHGRDTNIVSWTVKHAAVWSYVYAISIVGVWLIVPWYFPHVLMVVSIALAARTLPGAFRLWQTPDPRQSLALAARGAIAVACVGVLSVSVGSRTPPNVAAVDLTFPVRSGHYYIVNGGSTELTNAHVRMLWSGRFRRYRGSSYGVDIVGLTALGSRATGLAPRDLERYTIFGDPIYAPCEGIVVRAEDGLPDMSPPTADRAHSAGNFVVIECGDVGDYHVLLGHMRNGSVTVHPGDYVTTDTHLGDVGNSGNSDEPHLHVHAQRPGRIWDVFSGDPLPMRFAGRYLTRNDRITDFTASAGIIDD